jgi:outer membrane immunogenic protein
MKNFAFVTVALAAASPAFAQDAEPSAYGGARIEARAGWDRPTISLRASDGVDTIDESAGKSGVVYGGEVGYDYAVSTISFIGAYAGIEGSTTEECSEVYGGDEACLKAGRNITAGVRAGFMLSPSAAVYAKGGYSNGRVRVTYEDPAAPADNFEEGGNVDGFHLGAGAEFGLKSGIYAKLEYVYSNYGDYEYVDGTDSASLGLDRHQVVAGVGIRF